MKDVTLCFLRKNENDQELICLAMKKRGFGEGKWNGVGGKVQDEDIVEATIRETQEEISVLAKDLVKVAELDFITMDQRCHVFITESWEGEPAESEEMKPKWFTIHEIPYEEMWDDDAIWLPHILEGKTIKGTFHFDENDMLIDHTIEDTTF